MAAYEHISATLTLVYEVGMDGNGDAIFASQTYRSVDEGATVQQLSAVAAGIASLCEHPLNDVVKTQKDAIVNN